MDRLEELLRDIEGTELMHRLVETVEQDRHLCATCRRAPRLDGHLTCGALACDEGGARARALEAWRASRGL